MASLPCPVLEGRGPVPDREGVVRPPVTEPSPDAVDDLPTVAEVLVPVAVDQTYSYRIPPGMTVAPGTAVEVPLGPRRTMGLVWEVSSPASAGGNLKAIVAPIDAPPLRPGLRQLIDWVARWTLMPRGMVLRSAIRALAPAQDEADAPVLRRSGSLPKRPTPARARALEALAASEPQTRRGLMATAGVGAGVVDGLLADGVLLAELRPRPAAPVPDPSHPGKPLDADQQACATRLAETVRDGRFAVTLLQGVTGAGKTDVYFEAVAAALQAGRQVLILLPEIALTAQFLTRFAERFGTEPAVWHSEVGASRRARLWHGVATGTVPVVVGARSSLFLPFAALGLIIVDEEHEAAYKQDDGITYHARDMAVVRGQLEAVPVVLASATPSVETLVNAEAGRYRHLVLARRYGNRPLPHLQAVDMRRTPPARGSWLSPPLLAGMADTLARGEQVLLFLNRRGYAPLTLCRRCGFRLACPNCSAWLVEHRFRGTLACHHCGHAEPRPNRCPACDAPDALVACGPGVERLSEEVTGRFPDARTLLLSSDFPGGGAQMRQELRAVADGAVDIVIGTQLVAKGHHFPFLTLVGVIDVDIGLSNGDPRAAERTFQLLQQVTGRAGRGSQPGGALLQTYQPDHPVMTALLSGDAERFYATEIAGRRAAGLPPFGRLAALIVSAPDRARAEIHARALARAAAAIVGAAADPAVWGPAEAPLAMVRGRHRFRLLVKATRQLDLQGFLRRLLAEAPPARGGVTVAVDVDPQSFL